MTVVLALLLCACSQEVMGPHGRKPMLLSGTERPDRAPGSLLRADPGYIQWLERQSMLGNADDLAAERWVLDHGHLQVEVMCNLDKVPATGAIIFVMWPRIEDATGMPVRAVAVFEE